jgi:chromate reductase
MSTSVHILGFSGSLRKASYNSALLREAADMLPDGMTLEIFSLADIPLYNSDIEAEGWPDAVRDFRERIAAADALLIATPEYNFSVSGVLKNAIDWASRPPDSPLTNKPLAMMGTGGGFGTLRSQMHLRDIVLHNAMHPLNSPQVTVARAWEKFDAEGRLTDDHTRQNIRSLLEALAAWTRHMSSFNT